MYDLRGKERVSQVISDWLVSERTGSSEPKASFRFSPLPDNTVGLRVFCHHRSRDLHCSEEIFPSFETYSTCEAMLFRSLLLAFMLGSALHVTLAQGLLSFNIFIYFITYLTTRVWLNHTQRSRSLHALLLSSSDIACPRTVPAFRITSDFLNV